jgi:MoaA/NifB/PqqE/SkfB family radical SAM enzyme
MAVCSDTPFRSIDGIHAPADEARRAAFAMQVKRNYFKFMQWDITTRCNLSCTHCRSTGFYRDGDVHDLDLGSNLRIANEMFLAGVRRIHFLGGEPLMRPDFCKIAEAVNRLGVGWSVNTNATLLDEHVALRLLKADAHVITVSLDGPSAESNDAIRGRGVFDRVCENTARLTAIRNRLKKPTRVVIACTLVSRNAAEVGRMVDVATSLGVNSLILSSLQSRGNARTSFASMQVAEPEALDIGLKTAEKIALERSPHVQLGFLTPVAIQYVNEASGAAFPIYDASCGALKHKGYIQPDGALFPCQSMTDKEPLPPVIGPMPRLSLARHDFNSLWHSRRFEAILEHLFSPSVDPYMLPCRYCTYYRSLCYPCPLGALGGQFSAHHLCLKAMSRLAALRGVEAPWDRLLDHPSNIGALSEPLQKEACR